MEKKRRGEAGATAILTAILIAVQLVLLSLCAVASASAVDYFPGNLFTNNPRPTLTIFFDRNTTVENVTVYDSLRNYSFQAYQGSNRTIWNFRLLENLTQGDYQLRFTARDDFNNVEVKPPLVFHVDFQPPSVTIIQPLNGTVLTTSSQEIRLRVQDNNLMVQLLSVNLIPHSGAAIDITANFQEYPATYFYHTLDLEDSIYNITVIGADEAGNAITTRGRFIVNSAPLNVTLITPPYGVSPVNNFRFEVESSKSAQCGYTQNPLQNFTSMEMLSSQNGTRHFKNNVTLIQDENYTVYIQCRDYMGMISSKFQYELMWDPTPPVVELVDVFPNNLQSPRVINERLDTAYLYVRANERVRCRYTGTGQQDYAIMTPFEIFDIFSVENSHVFGAEIADGNNYSYIVRCENRAGLLSQSVPITFGVNLGAQAGIFVHTPRSVMNTGTFAFNITTAETTVCTLGNTTNPSEAFLWTDGRNHISASKTFPSGDHRYYIRCQFGAEPLIKEVLFTVDTVVPSAPNITADANSCNLARLSARFTATDNRGGELSYTYSVTWPGGTLVNWTLSDNTAGVDRSLQENATYTWHVKAIDAAGNVGPESSKSVKATDEDIVACDYAPPEFTVNRNSTANGVLLSFECDDVQSGCKNTFLFQSVPSSTGSVTCTPTLSRSYNQTVLLNRSSRICYLAQDLAGNNDSGSSFVSVQTNSSQCNDGTMNGLESDIDCGGACGQCDLGDSCNSDEDCTTAAYCGNGTCVRALCNDTVRNGLESDVDCGGSCSPCAADKMCGENTDCDSGYCSAGKCSAASCSDAVKNADESDVDCGGSCSPCAVNKRCVKQEDCASGNCYGGYCAGGESDTASEGPSLIAIILLVLGGLLMLGGVGYIWYSRSRMPTHSPQSKTGQVMPQKSFRSSSASQQSGGQGTQFVRNLFANPLSPSQKSRLEKQKVIKNRQRRQILQRFSDDGADSENNSDELSGTEDKKTSLGRTFAAGSSEKKRNADQQEYIDVRELNQLAPSKAADDDIFRKLESITSAESKDVLAEIGGAKSVSELESSLRRQLGAGASKQAVSDTLFELKDSGKISADDAKKLMQKLELI